MLVYKVDTKDVKQINSEMRQLATELATLTPTLHKLKTVVTRHAGTIDSPSITRFRDDLNHMLAEAQTINERLSENTIFLAEVSEQASEHLMSVEAHYDSILKDKTLSNYLAPKASRPQ